MSKKQKNQLKQFGILSGIAIEMGVTIYLAVKLGKWLDITYNGGEKGFVIATTLLGLAVAIYIVIIQLKHLQK